MADDQPKALHAWSGEFGDRYTERNAASAEAVRGRTRVWGEVFRKIVGDMPKSALEVGPNVGLNLQGIAALSPMTAMIWRRPAAAQPSISAGISALPTPWPA